MKPMLRQAIQGHGPTDSELEFVDLRESGLSVAECAAALGIGAGLAKHIELRMFPSFNDNLAFDEMIRAGTRRLGERLSEVLA